MITLAIYTLLLFKLINSNELKEIDFSDLIVVAHEKIEQLDAYKDSHNDGIIEAKENNNYSRLKWFSFGFPKLQKTTIENKTSVFHFTSNGFYTHIETLTMTHRTLLAEKASSKYSIAINSSQIDFMPLSKFTCFISLQDGSRETLIRGEVTQFKEFPLRMDFSAPRKTLERILIDNKVNTESSDILLKCEIAIKGNEIRSTFKLAPSIMNQFQIVYDLFGPHFQSVYITKVQIDRLAEKLYDKMDIMREYKIPEFEFKKHFTDDFIRQVSEASFEQQELSTAAPLLSNFSVDTDLDLRSFESEIKKYLMVDSYMYRNKYIAVRRAGLNELTDRHLVMKNDNGDLIYMGILELTGTSNLVNANQNNWMLSDTSLQEQLVLINSVTKNELQWELKGETIGIKSLNVVKLQRSSFSKTLVFNEISRSYYETPLKTLSLYTSAATIAKSDYEVLLEKFMEAEKKLDDLKRHNELKYTKITSEVSDFKVQNELKYKELSLKFNKTLSDFVDQTYSKLPDISKQCELKITQWESKFNKTLNDFFSQTNTKQTGIVMQCEQKDTQLESKFNKTLNDFFSQTNTKQTEISNQISDIQTLLDPTFGGIHHNKSLTGFTSKGFLVVYDHLYNHGTTAEELNGIRNGCTESSTLCVGGSDTQNPSMLLLVACGDCLQVTQTTVSNNPVLHNGVYWYYTPGVSFGFAPRFTIDQRDDVDKVNLNDKNRLSWWVHQNNGGWRLGSLTGLHDSTGQRYRKIILKLSEMNYDQLESKFNGRIHHNISLTSFKSKGFSVVYDHPYNHTTTEEEINEIRNECTSTSMLCVGGYDSKNSSILILVACGDCLQVTQATVKNSPVFHKGVYWYYTLPNISFGFSESYTIDQSWYSGDNQTDYIDKTDMSDPNRLSIELVGSNFRLGSLFSKDMNDDDKKYYKIILKLY